MVQLRRQEIERGEQERRSLQEKLMTWVHKQAENVKKIMEGMEILREEVQQLKQGHKHIEQNTASWNETKCSIEEMNVRLSSVEKQGAHQRFHEAQSEHQNDLDSLHRKWSDNHSSALERVSHLEVKFGESNSLHERQLRENEKMSKSVSDCLTKLTELHLNISGEKRARETTDALLQQRITVIEQALTDSEMRHKAAEALFKEHRDSHGRHVQQAEGLHRKLSEAVDRLQEQAPVRLDSHEKLLFESADQHRRHVRDVDDVRNQLQDLSSKMLRLEAFMGDGENKHRLEMGQATLFQRMDLLESDTRDALDRNQKVREEHFALLLKRLDYLSHLVGDTAVVYQVLVEENSSDFADVRAKHFSNKDGLQMLNVQKQSLESRLKYLEETLNVSPARFLSRADLDEHIAELREELHNAQKTHKISLEKRLEMLEQLMIMINKKVFDPANERELEEMEKANKEQAEITEKLDWISQPLTRDLDLPFRRALIDAGYDAVETCSSRIKSVDRTRTQDIRAAHPSLPSTISTVGIIVHSSVSTPVSATSAAEASTPRRFAPPTSPAGPACAKCGAVYQKDGLFCRKCGTRRPDKAPS